MHQAAHLVLVLANGSLDPIAVDILDTASDRRLGEGQGTSRQRPPAAGRPSETTQSWDTDTSPSSVP